MGATIAAVRRASREWSHRGETGSRPHAIGMASLIMPIIFSMAMTT